MDQICIDELELYARHGVYPEENTLGQKFVVCARLAVDTTKAARGDDLSSSVNYGEVCYYIRDWMDKHTHRLIETVANRLATDLLEQFPLVQAVELEVKKPNAPIMMPFASVSVKITRRWHQVYVSIGSNLGNREEQIRQAVLLLNQQRGCQVQKVSSLYVTAPYGYTEQPEFLNGCLLVRTVQEPEQFLDTLHAIEQHLGRERKMHWGPRTIDLDILLYDDLCMDTERLTVPHVDMENRMFVLTPLDEIAGFVRHPRLNRTIHQLHQALQNRAGGEADARQISQ